MHFASLGGELVHYGLSTTVVVVRSGGVGKENYLINNILLSKKKSWQMCRSMNRRYKKAKDGWRGIC